MNLTFKIGLCVAVVAAGVGLGARALAGARVYPNVAISGNSTAGTASGALGTARRVSGNQFISCDVSGAFSVHCAARTSAGATADCTLAILNGDYRASLTLGTSTPDSFITFKWQTIAGQKTCTYLQVVNSSEYEPKPL